MTVGYDDLDAAMNRLCSACAARRSCAVEGAAKVYWPEHQSFPAEWYETEGGWRCAAYQAPRLAGTGRIDDPSQVEMFSAVEMER